MLLKVLMSRRTRRLAVWEACLLVFGEGEIDWLVVGRKVRFFKLGENWFVQGVDDACEYRWRGRKKVN